VLTTSDSCGVSIAGVTRRAVSAGLVGSAIPDKSTELATHTGLHPVNCAATRLETRTIAAAP